MAKKPETVFRERAERDLKTLEPDVRAITVQQRSKRGDADKILCIMGDFAWLEFKAEDGEEEKIQTYKRHKIKQAGGHTFVAKPSNWAVVFEAIRMIVKRKKETKNDQVEIW